LELTPNWGGEWATLKRVSEGSHKNTGTNFQLHRYGWRWGGTTTKSPDIVDVTMLNESGHQPNHVRNGAVCLVQQLNHSKLRLIGRGSDGCQALIIGHLTATMRRIALIRLAGERRAAYRRLSQKPDSQDRPTSRPLASPINFKARLIPKCTGSATALLFECLTDSPSQPNACSFKLPMDLTCRHCSVNLVENDAGFLLRRAVPRPD
jgi:hypothetical protein